MHPAVLKLFEGFIDTT